MEILAGHYLPATDITSTGVVLYWRKGVLISLEHKNTLECVAVNNILYEQLQSHRDIEQCHAIVSKIKPFPT